MSPSPCQILSKSVKRFRRYGDLTVFILAAVRHLGFWKFNFLTVWAVKRPILHNPAKFCEDLPIRWCDIAIFVVVHDGSRRHLGFWKIRNFNDMPPVRGQSAPACQISSKSVKRLLRYCDLTVFFSKWRTSAILDLSSAHWDHPRRLLRGLYRWAKFGWNRCSTFGNMKVLIFCAFGLKTPIHTPKIGVLGGFDSICRGQY